jgi:hypothetical protein
VQNLIDESLPFTPLASGLRALHEWLEFLTA